MERQTEREKRIFDSQDPVTLNEATLLLQPERRSLVVVG